MTEENRQENEAAQEERSYYYRVRFRPDGQVSTAVYSEKLAKDGVVMVKTDHGLEPVQVVATAPLCGCRHQAGQVSYEIARPLTSDEEVRYGLLPQQEQEAFTICLELIAKHHLEMRLVRVERFFNGSKMIFYFTADNRVDFRELVKDLVQEFRTRVEMRQVGVRHETKMLGGMGTCGRELCCSSFIRKFDSVSIKMAKEQDLPLNPTKISGLCNRLLCCLTYEYETYRKQRKGMPKPGRRIKLGEEQFKVKRQNPLQQTVLVITEGGDERLLNREEWQACEPVKVDRPQRKEKKND